MGKPTYILPNGSVCERDALPRPKRRMKPLLISKQLTFELGGQHREFLVKCEVRQSKLCFMLYERLNGVLYAENSYTTMQRGEDAAKRMALHTTWEGNVGP